MAGVAKRNHPREYWRWMVTVLGLILLGGTQGIKFDVHEHECWVHETEADSEFVQMFVEVMRDDVRPGPFRHMGVDVVIQAPGGQYIHTEKVKHEAIPDVDTRYGVDINTKVSKYEATINFTAVEKGRHNICFHNRGNVVETVKLEILHNLVDYEEPVKNVHIRSLMEQMANLSDALVDVEFEQDWLMSRTDRHASILRDLSKRVVYKAVLEAFAFIACSLLQVVLLQRLLHKHLVGKQQ